MKNSPETQRAVALLKKLIAIPSFSRDETKLADFLSGYLTGLGLKVNRHLNNIWVTNRYWNPKNPVLLLNSHIDTVKPSSQYTMDPFQATEKDGAIYGLGSNDAGGCVVSLLETFLHFADQDQLKYNLIYAPTAEEEVSGLNGIESIIPMLGKVDCAIVGEPTGMQMAVAEKGLLVLDCTTHGRAGHAARDEGENAIYKAMPDMEFFRDYRFDKVSSLLGPNKMTVTAVQSGSLHNVVPGDCKFVVDIRINELYSHEEVLKQIQSHVKSEVKPRGGRLKSTSIALDHPLVKAGLSLGRTHYGSPTSSDKALMPWPALKIGPGESARSHTADEYIKISEISEGIRLYRELLEKVIFS